MTTCVECLCAMSKTRLTDIRSDSAIAVHYSSCASCASVAQEIAYAERRLATALRDMQPSYTPAEVLLNALEGSERIRRKEVGRWVRGLLAAAGCVTFWFFMQNVFVPWTDGSKRTAMETITLRCLTAEQASELATPYLRSHGSAIYLTKNLHSITIRGRADEFVRARAELKGIDARAQCPVAGPQVTPLPGAGPTSTDKPGKD